MTDHLNDEEFAPIAAAMKRLPQYAPSPLFADKVMARVRVAGAPQALAPARQRPAAIAPMATRTFDRRAPAPPSADYRRSLPARLAAATLVASVGVTMSIVALVTIFDLDLILLVTRVFGESSIAFLTSLAGEASASVAGTATGAAAAAGTAAGVAVIGSFVAGAVATTAVLRAAASASRKVA